jgi:EmrB/QacA subfamily drug resistance transporter
MTGQQRVTLIAMTLANSMILVDQTAVPLAIPHVVGGLHASDDLAQWVLTANVLPLAAFMVLGGRMGDIRGLRKVFLAGALVFIVSSTLAGLAQGIEWLIVVRATQGIGAALMMPTTIAIVSAVFPDAGRGRALGIMAGASAFFAALGPVLGGLLTQFIDWRAVFFINVPLAAITILLTLRSTPELPPKPGVDRRLDWPGVVVFAVAASALVLGLSEGQAWGWGDTRTVLPLVVGVAGLIAFAPLELRRSVALIKLGLFRHLNFAAANASQTLAGMIELGMGFILPLYLLLVLGLDPALAGIALIPATVPIIVVAPLAGRVFDRRGGRVPLVVGFAILAASSVELALVVPDRHFLELVPGLVLQGIGLGTILTVNDPTGINPIPEQDRGQASGVIDTTEQFGGALGIALLYAVLIGTYVHNRTDIFASHRLPTGGATVDQLRAFIIHAEQTGLNPSKAPQAIVPLLSDARQAFLDAFQTTMVVSAVIAALGALVCAVLVRKGDRVAGRIFSRRSRWAYANPGGPGLTRKPVPEEIG